MKLLATLAALLALALVASPQAQESPRLHVEQVDAQREIRKLRKALRWHGRKLRQAWREQRRLRRRYPEGFARAGLWCIHRGEGAWNAATGNGYYGGLQMDMSFQRTYGSALLSSLGTANHWPPAAQLAVGEIAYYAGRGFGPWPNTRKMCGL